MSGHQDSHRLTLPQVSTRVRIDGTWPEPIVLSRGCAKATARPWNDEDPSPMLRLERGASDFLSSATETLIGLTNASVYSPAIYPGSTRIWSRCGYEEVAQLRVMERPLSLPIGKPVSEVTETEDPDWNRLRTLDRKAFEGFWRMSVAGLEEARAATRRSTVFLASDEDAVVGYAIVGAQWNVAYLQRIAVDPAHSGRGLGTDLIRPHSVGGGVPAHRSWHSTCATRIPGPATSTGKKGL